MAKDLVDQLLAQPGLYLGPQRDPSNPGEESHSVARIMVTALPGNSGVSFDYEVLSAENGRPHAEHTVLARTAEGPMLFTAHVHAPVLTPLREQEPGYFAPAEGDSPFPMAIRIEVPEKGRIVYSWSFGEPGGKAEVRDIGDVRLVT